MFLQEERPPPPSRLSWEDAEAYRTTGNPFLMFALKTGLPPEVVLRLYPLPLESIQLVTASLSFRLRASALFQITRPVTSGGVIPPTDGLAEGEAEADADNDGLALGDTLAEGDTEAEADWLADKLGEEEAEADFEADGLADGETEALADRLGDAEAEMDGLAEGDADLLADLLALIDKLGEDDGEVEALPPGLPPPLITGIVFLVLRFTQSLPI